MRTDSRTAPTATSTTRAANSTVRFTAIALMSSPHQRALHGTARRSADGPAGPGSALSPPLVQGVFRPRIVQRTARPHPTGVTGAVAVDRAVRAHRSWAGVTGRGVVPREGQRFHRCVARYRCVVRHSDPHGSATDRLPGTVPAELPERKQTLLRRPALTSD